MIKTFYFKDPHENKVSSVDNTINAWALQEKVRVTSVASGAYFIDADTAGSDLDLMGAYMYVTVTYEQQKPVLDEKTL